MICPIGFRTSSVQRFAVLDAIKQYDTAMAPFVASKQVREQLEPTLTPATFESVRITHIVSYISRSPRFGPWKFAVANFARRRSLSNPWQRSPSDDTFGEFNGSRRVSRLLGVPRVERYPSLPAGRSHD